MCWRSTVGQDVGPDSAAAAQDDQSPHRVDAPADTNDKRMFYVRVFVLPPTGFKLCCSFTLPLLLFT